MYLPQALQALLGNAALQRDTVGLSDDAVYRIEGDPVRYLKISDYAPEIIREAEGLAFLQGKVPVPQVEYFAEEKGRYYLLTRALPGQMACAPTNLADGEAIAYALGRAMARLHAQPIAGAPQRTLDTALAFARAHVESGAVDTAEWDDSNTFSSPQELLAYLVAHRPAREDLVFTHGDFCLPNVFFKNGTLTGFLDLGRCGVADRYQDLALAQRSLGYNLGGRDYFSHLLRGYGLPQPDEEKLRYYLLLDELF